MIEGRALITPHKANSRFLDIEFRLRVGAMSSSDTVRRFVLDDRGPER